MASAALTRPTRRAAATDLYLLAVVATTAAVAWVGSPAFRDRVVGAVSALAFGLSSAKRHGTDTALARAFGPRSTPRRRRTIARRAFREYWGDVFRLRRLRGETDAALPIVGEAHLREALAQGRGAILWVSNHWAGMSVLKRALHARGLPVHKVHAELHLGGFPGEGDTWLQQRVVEPYFDRHEEAIVASILTIKRGSLAIARDIAARLRENGIVCAAADGRIGQRFVPQRLLGVDEAFATGVVSLARTSGAPLLPVFCLPGPRRTSQVVIEAPVPLADERDRDEVARRTIAAYAERLERRARRFPSRYVNWHLIGDALPKTIPQTQTISDPRATT